MAKTKSNGQAQKGKQKFIQFSDVLIIILFCLGLMSFIVITWQGAKGISDPSDFDRRVTRLIDDLVGDDEPEPKIETVAQFTVDKFDSRTYTNREGMDLSNEFIAGENSYVKPGMIIQVPRPGEERTPVTEVNVETQGSSQGKINIKWTPVKNDNCKYYKIRWWRMSSFNEDEDYTKINVRNAKQFRAELGEGEKEISSNAIKDTITGVTPNEEYLIDVQSYTVDHEPCSYQEAKENAYIANVISPGDEKEMPRPANFRVEKATLAGVELKWDDIIRIFKPEVHPGIDFIKVAIFRWKNGNEDEKEFLNPPDDANPFGTMLNSYQDLSIEPDVPYNYGIQYFHTESYPDWDNKKVNYLYDELLEIRIQDVDPQHRKAIFKDNKPVFVVKKVFASKMIRLPEPIILKDRPVVVVESIFGALNPDRENSYAKILLTVYKNLPIPENPAESKFVRVKVKLDVKHGDILKGSTTKPKEIDGEPFSRSSRYGKMLKEKNITIDFETSLKVVGIHTIEYKYSKGSTDSVMYVELLNTDPEYKDCWSFKVYKKKDIDEANKIREAEANGEGKLDENGLRKKALVPNNPEDKQRGLNKEERKELLKKVNNFAKKYNQSKRWYRAYPFGFSSEFEDLLWEFAIENELRFYPQQIIEGFPILENHDQLLQLVKEF